MSNRLRKVNSYKISECESNHYYYDNLVVVQPRKKVQAKKKNQKNKLKFIVQFFALMLLVAYGYFVCPYNFNHYFKPLYLNRFLNRNIHLDVSEYINPTSNYLHNSFLIDKFLQVSKVQKTKEITQIQIIDELTDTKNKLLELFKKYTHLEPSVFVWEYSSGKGLEINADKVYPSASIIKVPIVFELIRLVDETSSSINPIALTDKRVFTEFFRTSGSGDLQKTKADVSYSLDYLANIMIANSDNSATNMLLYEIGGIDGFNRSMRNLGLKVTSMSNWLPDLEGTNKITAREISTLFYNIDNPNYINDKYKNILKEYLGNTRNTHLIKEKLPQDVMVLHKTGDIGQMLGDSGIVYANNGRKYIVTILVKRPHNDYGAKMLIQDASLLIYNDINNF